LVEATTRYRQAVLGAGRRKPWLKPSTVMLECGHLASDDRSVVIRPIGKIKFDCPYGCGLQAVDASQSER